MIKKIVINDDNMFYLVWIKYQKILHHPDLFRFGVKPENQIRPKLVKVDYVSI